MTVHYARWQAEEEAERRKREPQPVDPTAPIERAIDEIRNREPQLGTEVAAELVHILELARDAVHEREEDRMNELAMLRVLATTGAMVSIFDHELRAMVDTVRSLSLRLKRTSERLYDSEPKHEVLGAAQELQEWVDTLEQYGLQLSVLLGREARDRRRIFPLRPLLDDMVRPFLKYLREYGIRFENEVPAGLRLPAIYQCEIHSIFLNLITNSAKALKRVQDRRIAVKARPKGSRVEILFLDSGPGVALERREEVFRPFVSDSEPDPILGTGTGLGLKIVKDIVEIYGGTVRFADPPEGWGACVEIVFPSS